MTPDFHSTSKTSPQSKRESGVLLSVLAAYHDGLLEREAALMAELKEVREEKRRARIEYHEMLEDNQ